MDRVQQDVKMGLTNKNAILKKLKNSRIICVCVNDKRIVPSVLLNKLFEKVKIINI